MLTRVKRKISKQMHHEKRDSSAEKSEKSEDSPGRKHSTVERKQSRAERKRSAAEKKHAHLDKSLKSPENNPEMEHLTCEMQGLQAEVNALRNELQEETKRSQELESLKSQQVSALTFKLDSAVWQQEKAEGNAARAMSEMERFRQSQVTDINGSANVMSIEKREEYGKLRRHRSDESGKLVERGQENCHVSDDSDNSNGNNTADIMCCRKTGIIISPNALQTMMERREENLCNDSGFYSFYSAASDVSSVKNQHHQQQHDAETQTLIQEDTSVDEEVQGNSASSAENNSTHQAYQELVSQELSLMQEELRDVKGNMSMMRALNQRLSEDLQSFSKTYEHLQGQKGGLCSCRDKESKREQNNNKAVSPHTGIVSEGYHGIDVLDFGICEPQIEVETPAGKLEIFEKQLTTQVADVNLTESEWKKPSDEDDCGSTMGHRKVCMPEDANVPQERGKETLRDSERKTEPGLRQVNGCEEPNEVRIDDDDDVLHSTEEKKPPDVATVHQMEVLQEQLKIAMMEIDKLRSDNSDMKRELRKISTSTEFELLLKTSKFTDQLLSEITKRETAIRSHDTYSSVGNYPSALEPGNCGSETEGVSSPKTVTLVQSPQLTAQPGMPPSVEGLERSSRPSIPVRFLGNHLHEMTETSGDMTERTKKQELVQMCDLDPLIHRSSAPVSSTLKRRYQRPVLTGESSCASDTLRFNPNLASSEGALVAPEKLGELGTCSESSVQLVERMKPGFLDKERSKPLDFSGAIRQSRLLRDARKPVSMQYNDYIQRHIVRSSDYIAKLRDLKPEELDRPQED